MKTHRETRETARAATVSCANEGCPRETRPGESFCDTCGLERSLFRRDLRSASNRPPTAPR